MVWVEDAPLEEAGGSDLPKAVDLTDQNSHDGFGEDNDERIVEEDSDSDDDSENESEDESEEDSDSDVYDDSDDESEDDDSEDDSEYDSDEDDSDEDIFEYPDVIDGASKIGPNPNLFDEDIGGQTIDSASVVAAGAVGSAIMGKRNTIIISIVVAGVFSYIMYLMYLKIADLRREIANLESQQEMGLNDKDVKAISTQVLEDFLREGSSKVESDVEPDVQAGVEQETEKYNEKHNEAFKQFEQATLDEVKEVNKEVEDVKPSPLEEGFVQDVEAEVPREVEESQPLLKADIPGVEISAGEFGKDVITPKSVEAEVPREVEESQPLLQADIPGVEISAEEFGKDVITEQSDVITEKSDVITEQSEEVSVEVEPAATPKKRGRPRKKTCV